METDASLGTFMQPLKFQQLQTPMIIRQLFLGCFANAIPTILIYVDASNFEKVLQKNSIGLNSEQPYIFIYIILVRDHDILI